MEFVGDVSEENDVTRFASIVQKRWGRADVLVNNAGISFISPAEQVSASDFRRVLAVNLPGPFLLCKAFGTMMLAQRSGRIINVASVAGLVGIADRAAYNASKHGLIGLTRTLAAERGARGVPESALNIIVSPNLEVSINICGYITSSAVPQPARSTSCIRIYKITYI